MGAPVGNKNAARAREWRDAIKWALENHEDSSVQRGQALREIAKKAVEDALSEDASVRRAAREAIGDRLDGKPAQAIVGDDELPPVQIKGVIELVRPS